jgi:ComF family protein
MKIRYDISRFLWKMADFVYPPTCPACHQLNTRFCKDCLATVNLLTHSFCLFCGAPVPPGNIVCVQCSTTPVFVTNVAAWGVYEGPLRGAIHALKYKSDLGLGDFFSRFLIEILLLKQWEFDLVIPVPISKKHQKERSYNQSALLARPIADFFGVEYSSRSLARIRDTGSQINRNKEERDIALNGAFLGNPDKLKGRKVLLVDDIITTGATVNHCAEALIISGAQEVKAISLARTMRHGSPVT